MTKQADDNRISTTTRAALAAVVCILYAVSLGLNAFRNPSGTSSTSGLEVLEIGWGGVVIGEFAWYANPLFVWALLAYWTRRYVVALRVSVAALLLACQSFAGVSGSQYIASFSASQLQTGFYIWFSALVIFLLGVVAVRDADANVQESRQS